MLGMYARLIPQSWLAVTPQNRATHCCLPTHLTLSRYYCFLIPLMLPVTFIAVRTAGAEWLMCMLRRA
jgi:hypothetical protein